MKQKPDRAKSASDAIFESMYESIFGDIDFNELDFGIRLYWDIMKYREFIEDEIRIRGPRRVQRDFITYGVFHVLFACRILVQRDGTLRSDREALVKQALDLVQKVVVQAGNIAYYSFFRRPGTAG